MFFSKLSSTKNIKASNLSTQFGSKTINNAQLSHIKGGESDPAHIAIWDLKEL